MSIYVAIEVLKWFQVRNMEKDPQILQDPGNVDLSKMALGTGIKDQLQELAERNKVQISNPEVIENLGQVDMCICDKTGTLTQNAL